MKKYIIALSSIALIVACSPKNTEVISEVQPSIEPMMLSAEVSSGKSLYESKCQKCHKLKIVEGFSEDQWNKILPVMAEKAKLENSETDLIQQYVTWELEN